MCLCPKKIGLGSNSITHWTFKLFSTNAITSLLKVAKSHIFQAFLEAAVKEALLMSWPSGREVLTVHWSAVSFGSDALSVLKAQGANRGTDFWWNILVF